MFDSVYSIALSILRELGGDDTVKYDSTYSIALAILDVLGGDTTKKYDSVYSILLDIYKTRFGTVLSGMDSSYSILNEINKAFDPSDTSKYDSSYETLIAISEHMVPAGYVFEIVTDSANTVIINGVERTSAQFETGTEVSWSVSRTGYVTQSGTYTMGEEDYSLTVTLVLDQFTYTIVPLPADATVVINEQQRSSITADYGTIITWTVSRTGYATQTGSFTLTEDRTDTIGLIANQYTLTINPTPNDATVVINGVERRSYTEDYGTAAVWSVSKVGYVTQSNIDILTSDTTRNITLVEVQYTFSIVPNPSDATVMINGVAQSSVNVSDGATLTWSVSKTGYATQTGSYTIDGADHTENVDLSPLEFTVTITPDPFDATVIINRDERDIYTGVYGEEIEWEVSAEGFETQTGSFTLVEDVDLEIVLEEESQLDKYLTFDILSDGTIVWTGGWSDNKTIQYSINDGPWTSITASNYGSSFRVSVGDSVRFKGTNTAYGTSGGVQNRFNGGTATYDVSGNIMSLVGGDNFASLTTLNSVGYNFKQMFNAPGPVDASRLLLPATTLSVGCYSYMFSGCTTLELAPELPATTLTNSCYQMMFSACSSLMQAPELPATTLTNSCYQNMFTNCSSLDYIVCLATDISAAVSTNNWVNGVAAEGTFVKAASMSGWSSGISGIPSGWTVENAS